MTRWKGKKFKKARKLRKGVSPWKNIRPKDDVFGLHQFAVGMLGTVILDKAKKEGWSEERIEEEFKFAEPLAKSLAEFDLATILTTPIPTQEEKVEKYGYLQTPGSLSIEEETSAE